jgi:U6 snRNA-associated Sm-like protein LSm7
MSNAAVGKNTGGGPPKKESILELTKMMDSKVRVKCLGGRELEGILRGFDDLVNLVLDDCEEYIRGTLFLA